jgi:hypothetical protein
MATLLGRSYALTFGEGNFSEVRMPHPAYTAPESREDDHNEGPEPRRALPETLEERR